MNPTFWIGRRDLGMINPIPSGGGVNLTPPVVFLHNSKSIGLRLLKFSDFFYIPKALPLGLKPGFNTKPESSDTLPE